MSHLCRSEIVDLVDDTLSPARAAHVETCASCREQVETVRAALREAMAVDVPDPSPLFWQHFQARVREGIARAPRPSMWAWIRVGGFAPLAAALVAVLAVGVAIFGGLTQGRWALLIDQHVAPRVEPSGTAVAGVESADPGIAQVLEAADSEVWAVLTAAAADVELEEAHAVGMHVHSATIDRAVQRMSPAELNELGRLLQSELKHSMN
jgi:hypothetical protein